MLLLASGSARSAKTFSLYNTKHLSRSTIETNHRFVERNLFQAETFVSILCPLVRSDPGLLPDRTCLLSIPSTKPRLYQENFSTMEKPLVGRDDDRQAARASRTPTTTEIPKSPAFPREPAPLWIELIPNAEPVSDKPDQDTVSNSTMTMRDFTNPVHSENLRTSELCWKTTLADEKGDYNVSHDKESGKSSKGSISVAAIESDIVYPSTLRVLLVTVSLAIAIFLVGLDRTIVATAT